VIHWAAQLLMVSALVMVSGCIDNAPALDLAMDGSAANAMHDSSDAATERTAGRTWAWEPIIADGRIRGIDERYARGLIRIVRLYAFDTAGTLRHYRELHLRGDSLAPWPSITAAGIDSAVMADAPVEATTVEFLAGVPMYSVRRAGRGVRPLQRFEMRAIVARAHTLYSRASNATASR
jgi:hypothetical protein